jgi:hypothetical protein
VQPGFAAVRVCFSGEHAHSQAWWSSFQKDALHDDEADFDRDRTGALDGL